MVYTLPYQMYKCEHGLTAAEQRAADGRGDRVGTRPVGCSVGEGNALHADPHGRP
jgi:hypothetical protein